jgi:hypothetical protein
MAPSPRALLADFVPELRWCPAAKLLRRAAPGAPWAEVGRQSGQQGGGANATAEQQAAEPVNPRQRGCCCACRVVRTPKRLCCCGQPRPHLRIEDRTISRLTPLTHLCANYQLLSFGVGDADERVRFIDLVVKIQRIYDGGGWSQNGATQ